MNRSIILIVLIFFGCNHEKEALEEITVSNVQWSNDLKHVTFDAVGNGDEPIIAFSTIIKWKDHNKVLGTTRITFGTELDFYKGQKYQFDSKYKKELFHPKGAIDGEIEITEIMYLSPEDREILEGKN